MPQIIVNGFFDINQYNQLVGVNSGPKVWGGAISAPYPRNYKSTSKSFNKEIRRIFIASCLSKPHFYLWTKKILPSGLKSRGFRIEKHIYKGGRFAARNRDFVSEPDLIEGQIISIETNKNNQILTLAGREHILEIKSKEIVLASGAIYNAFLLNMITGKDQYFFGNHLSAIVGTIEFEKPQRSNGWAQGWFENEKSFITLQVQRGKSRLSPSLRFHPTLESRVYDKYNMRKNPRPKFKKFDIRLMLDIQLCAQNFIKFSPNQTTVSFYPTKESLESGIELLEAFEQMALGSDKFELKFSGFFDPDFRSIQSLQEVDWVDAAHYFGTHTESNFQSIHENTNLLSGINLLGAGNFPTISHSHPTYLVLEFSKKMARILHLKLK